jgi:hypothetical protein
VRCVQVAFKAKPVPKSVTQSRLDVIQEEARKKKEMAKRFIKSKTTLFSLQKSQHLVFNSVLIHFLGNF